MSDEDTQPDASGHIPIQRVMSTLDKIAKTKQGEEDKLAKILENENDWRAVVNRMMDTPDGRFFMKFFLRYCRVNKVDNPHYQVLNIETNGKRKVYLELIRPYLDKSLRAELENQE